MVCKKAWFWVWCKTKTWTERYEPVFCGSALAPNLCVSFLKLPLPSLAHQMPFIFPPYVLLGGGWEWGWFEGACGLQFQAGIEQFTCRSRVCSCDTGDPLPMQTQRSEVWAKWCPPTREVLQLTLSSVLLLQHSGGGILPLPEVHVWVSVRAETIMETQCVKGAALNLH